MLVILGPLEEQSLGSLLLVGWPHYSFVAMVGGGGDGWVLDLSRDTKPGPRWSRETCNQHQHTKLSNTIAKDSAGYFFFLFSLETVNSRKGPSV